MSEHLKDSKDNGEQGGCSEEIKDKQPRESLIKAVTFVEKKEEALELGPREFTNVKFMLSEGFGHITAVDISNSVKDEFDKSSMPKDKVELILSPFDIVNAQFSLPFILPDKFKEVIDKIKKSLKKNGIFVGTFFGERDEWKDKEDMSFHTEEQVREMLSDMEEVELKQEEKEGKTYDGKPKHWHIIHFIFRKK